jgi:hypothetical protein
MTKKELNNYVVKMGLGKSFQAWIDDITIKSDRDTITDSYYSEKEYINNALKYERDTPWLVWNRAKRTTRKRTTSFLVLLSMKEIDKLAWSIDIENKNRTTPKIVVRETVKDKNGSVLHKIGDLIENEKYLAIENLIVSQLEKYDRLASVSQKLYDKGYRLSYGNVDRTVCVIHANGKIVNYLTNELYDSLTSYCDTLPVSQEKKPVIQNRITPELITDWQESEIQGLYDKEQLKLALKTYNHYTFYKMNVSQDEEVSYAYDNGDIVIRNTESDTETYLPSELVSYDSDTISGEDIARKGDTFIPIYVIPEESDRVLPTEESTVKVTYKNGDTKVIQQTWKAKAKQKSDTKKLSITAQWLKENDKKKAV